ncbi:hypothetical protein KEM52_001429 [Ascosphaera acerosa]|nr:hypothetical protein KEM52_001429 [Ascosphaera acerosa]
MSLQTRLEKQTSRTPDRSLCTLIFPLLPPPLPAPMHTLLAAALLIIAYEYSSMDLLSFLLCIVASYLTAHIAQAQGGAVVPRAVEGVLVSWPDAAPAGVVDRAVRLVRERGGVVTAEYSFSAIVPSQVLSSLAALSDEWRPSIEPDQEVHIYSVEKYQEHLRQATQAAAAKQRQQGHADDSGDADDEDGDDDDNDDVSDGYYDFAQDKEKEGDYRIQPVPRHADTGVGVGVGVGVDGEAN